MNSTRENLRPSASVIVAVKNGAASLQGCIDSIVGQDWDSRETIVIDSASTDGTQELLEANFRAGKISAFVSEPDHGIYEAWNKALRLYRGEWVCFLGCDDRYHDAKALEEMLRARVEGIRVIYGRVNVVTPSGEVRAVHGNPWQQARAGFLAGTMISHPGTLHHRSLFEEHGYFDESYRISGDYELLLRELREREAIFVDRVVVDMRLGGLSSTPAAIHTLWREVQRAREKHGMHGIPARLRMTLLASWLGMWIHRWLGNRAYRWCADLYRLARGKRRIWTVEPD